MSLFALAFVVFAFGICQPAMMTANCHQTLDKAWAGTKPPADASAQEWDAWHEQQRPVRDATVDVAGRALATSALTSGLPIAILLVVVVILLYRLKGMVRRLD